MRGCSGQGGIDEERESSSSRWVFLTQILYSLRYWRFSVPVGGVPHLEATGSIPVAGATFIYPAGLWRDTTRRGNGVPQPFQRVKWRQSKGLSGEAQSSLSGSLEHHIGITIMYSE